jgi:exodeoxyribonuclease V alpha subunit
MWNDSVEREISIEMIEALKLAYTITIYKIQGFQFERVVIPLERAQNLDRTMFYTEIARAKKEVLLIGDINTLSDVLGNEFSQSRSVNLSGKVKLLYQE